MEEIQTNNIVLDTCIIRYLISSDAKIKPLADYYWDLIKYSEWFISFIVIGELWGWVFKENIDSNKTKKLFKLLRKAITIDINNDIACKYGKIISYVEKDNKNSKNMQNDAWIAACAMTEDFYLVTNDEHFDKLKKMVKILPRYNENRTITNLNINKTSV